MDGELGAAARSRREQLELPGPLSAMTMRISSFLCSLVIAIVPPSPIV
jgi:hypothetical protein